MNYDENDTYTDYDDMTQQSSVNSDSNAYQHVAALDIYPDTGYKNGAKNKNGILKKFKRLLEYNPDVKGWLTIPGTCIDYPVMQNNDIDFYLDRDFEKNKDKNGSLYIDEHSTVYPGCKNIVIHGHNMFSTRMMFYELPKYKDIDFYKAHPVIRFDTIYEESEWKIISYMRLQGHPQSSEGFNYMTGYFDGDNDFNEFLYQIELRSPYYCPVDVNENDTLLMLSTCTGELDDGRGVVVARKVRPDESPDVDTSSAYEKSQVLYPSIWYRQYGGVSPIVTDFDTARLFGEACWYDGEIDAPVVNDVTFEDDTFIYRLKSATSADITECKDKNSTEIRIPDSVTYLGHNIEVEYALAGCFQDMKNLEKLSYNNVIKKIPDRAFKNCTKLNSVLIGESVESIGFKAFYNLESLKKLFIRSKVLNTVDKKAFGRCRCVFKINKEFYSTYKLLIESSGIEDNTEFVKLKE